MKALFRWIKRLVLLALVLILALLSPVAYVEVMCRPQGASVAHDPAVGPDWQRPEGRTLLTYPEWHIVHAYADYAEVIRTGDPHDFGFFSSITDFWSSTCALSKASGPHGGFPWETKQMVYVIGVSFTAELALKAGYEETLGRLFTLLRGQTRAPLDDLSAGQAADYATFLQMYLNQGELNGVRILSRTTVETILRGKAETPFLKAGDTVRIEMLDDQHHSIFGAIEQTVAGA